MCVIKANYDMIVEYKKRIKVDNTIITSEYFSEN